MTFRLVIPSTAALLAGAALAQAPAPAGQTATVTRTTTTTSKPRLGATTVTERHQTSTAATSAAGGHVVAVKTKTGKTLHYDCSKPGNKNKAACKA